MLLQVLDTLKHYIHNVIQDLCFYYKNTPYVINQHSFGIVQDMDEYAAKLPNSLLKITQYDSDRNTFTYL